MEISDAGNLLVAIGAKVPETLAIERWTVDDLPANWRDYPAPAMLAGLGNEWAHLKRSAVLFVPSVVIPSEENVLLNPEHPEFERIEIGEPRPFAFDSRMWKS
jgi:RES domain-containing protein